jgi:hypothetical protein
MCELNLPMLRRSASRQEHKLESQSASTEENIM